MTTEPLLISYRGKTPQVSPDAYITPGAVLVGDVRVAAGASVWFGCVLRGDDHYIEIGEGANVQDGTVIHVTLETDPTIVGVDAIIGHGARLHGCRLGDGCLIGIGAVVLDGAVVEPGGFLAAGALLPPRKVVPSGELWAGNPARKLRDLRDGDREFMTFDSAHYRKLTAEYLSAS